jgi:hypothetical protein
MKRDRRLRGEVMAEAWYAIGEAAAHFEACKRAIALDQTAAVISSYSERASLPSIQGEEAYLTHDDVGYLAATDVRLLFWAAHAMEFGAAA